MIAFKKCVFLTFLSLTLIGGSVFADEVTAVESNIIEFKTQAPPDPFPEAPKDCYEYLYGKLSAIRRHGDTWQNGVADCSNCTCDNGDIRCFFHFCNEPSTGYMTPPTIDDETILSPPSTEDDELAEEESSGFPPHDLLDEDTEGEAEWPPRIKPEKWEKELSGFETSASSAVVTKEDKRFLFVHGEDQQDRTENETHDIFKTYFCGKICKKSCPQGFKVDRVTGCWKCRCNKCPSRVTCEQKCSMGYAVDSSGCDTCRCVTPSEPNNEDIVFTDEYDASLFANDIDNELDKRGKHLHETLQRELESYNSSSSSSSSEEDEEEKGSEQDEREKVDEEKKGEEEDEEEKEEGTEVEENEESLYPFKISTLPNGRKTLPMKKGLSPGDMEVTSFPSIRVDGFDQGEEPCNTTQLRGCLDGVLKFAVGESWSRGPCVACRCVAPGYSECNITQCHTLHQCPQSRRFTPPRACCPICTDDTPTPGFLEKIYESRSTSRVPTELLPPRQTDDNNNNNLGKDVNMTDKDKATITSVPRDDQSHLLLILIPMGILFSAGVLLFAHLWRRYHRDKYDINAYRPEEKQKLRPVKTLNDDTSSLGHVC